MTALAIEDRISQPAYYHRDYEHDVKDLPTANSLLQKAQRVVVMALPFLALYKPLGSAITMGMNTTRSISCLLQTKNTFTSEDSNSKDKSIALFQTTVAVMAVAGTIFGNVYGMMIASGYDVLVGLYEMTQCLQKGEHEQALEKFLQVITNSLYLTMIVHGSVEIVVLSLAAQILLEAYKSQASFRKFKNSGDVLDLLEGFAHLGMAGIRGYQIQPHCKLLKVKLRDKSTLGIEGEELHLYEDVIEQLLGKKYLYFISGNGQEKFLILSAADDWNGALNPSYGLFCEDLKLLNECFDIKFHTISKVSEIETEINLAAQAGRVTALMLRAHGSPEAMQFGADPDTGILRKGELSPTTFKNLDPDCIIILESCETAQYVGSLAYYIANLAQRVTYAADYSFSAGEFKLVQINPLEWNFDWWFIPTHTKIILPKKEPSVA